MSRAETEPAPNVAPRVFLSREEALPQQIEDLEKVMGQQAVEIRFLKTRVYLRAANSTNEIQRMPRVSLINETLAALGVLVGAAADEFYSKAALRAATKNT